MSRDGLRRQIRDALAGRGRFADLAPSSGMASPDADVTFAMYFNTLSNQEKERCLVLLADMESGRDSEGTDALQAGHLLIGLAVTHAPWFHVIRERLERDFANPTNLRHWAHAEEQKGISHTSYAQGYERAIVLYMILARLGTERVEGARRYLVEHARSRRLRHLLQLNGSMIGMGLADRPMIHGDTADPDRPGGRRVSPGVG